MAQNLAQRIRHVKSKIQELGIKEHRDPSHAVSPDHFGFVKFDENPIDSSTRLSQYIRLDLNTSADNVVRFLQEAWELPMPDLIISVTGGAKNFDMSARLRKVFQRGLVAAAMTTNAWLITAGTNAGVVKEVGQALSNYRYKNRKQGLDVTCIGIGSWGYTTNAEELLVGHQSVAARTKAIHTSKSPSRFASLGQSTIHVAPTENNYDTFVRTYVVKKQVPKRCDLEPNHSHFLLFDDGKEKADAVLSLRAEIEKLSRNVKLTSSSNSDVQTLIPIIMVLVEGGPSSCRTICEALESQTPVVVVKDSGRSADLVAELHAIFSDGEKNNGSSHSSRPHTSVPHRSGNRETQIREIFNKAKVDNPWVDEVEKDLLRVLEKHIKLVTIFKFDSKTHHGNLEDAILEALFNANRVSDDQDEEHRRRAELKLAMAWHKFDYAKRCILTDTNISKWKPEELHRALFEALRRGHTDFVELLTEFGASFEELTYGDLKALYATSDQSSNLPLKHHRRSLRKTQDDYYRDYFKSFGHYSEIKNEFPRNPDIEALGQAAARHLFFWALFMNRFDLAQYLCSKNWNSSVAALFGAQVYRRAARLESDFDVKKLYEGYAHIFDNHSMNIVDRCFDNDENFAVDMIKRPAAAFDNIDSLTLAYKAQCRSFLASKSVQRLLDNTWFGFINYKRQAINIRIFLCSLFIPLFPIFCFFLPYVQKRKHVSLTSADDPKALYGLVQNTAADYEATKPKKPRVNWTDKILHFYRAPIVRFYYYTIFFVLFLGLFSFVLLVDYFPPNIHNGRRSGFQGLYIPITEIILHICIWSLIIEEIRQFIYSPWKRDYFAEVWNIIDLCAIVLYLVGFIARFFVSEGAFAVSKIFMCLDLIVWYVRTLHLFAAYEKLGPKLLMIFDTMKDLLFFVCFIFIFLLAFSITSWSLITTRDQVIWNYASDGSLYNVTITGGGSGLWSWRLLRDVTDYGVWKIFGQVDLTDGQDSYSAIAFVLAILFLAIANVLLLNLLVALFNLTIQNVQSQSQRIWRYQRFLLVFEYKEKPALPPPFSNLYYVYASLGKVLQKCQSYREKQSESTINDGSLQMDSVTSSPEESSKKFVVTDVMQREDAIADDYWRFALQAAKKDPMEITLKNLEQTLHSLKERVLSSSANGQASHSQGSSLDE